MADEEQFTITFNRRQFNLLEEVMTEYNEDAAVRYSWENWNLIQEIRKIIAAGRNANATGQPGAPPPTNVPSVDDDQY